MNEFSIELASEKIVDHKTKDYFVEVLRSFISGNYRSAVVMLWAVVIADLVYKLQTLRDIYQDETATAILESIETKQKSNPSSPEWELCLLEKINKRTHLLEISDYQHILHLQKIRHLSAHPVLSSANLLFSPNKETVRSLIRNALEAVLLKPPIFSKKIVGEFVTDIAAKKDLLPDQKGLKRYIDAKYFKNLSPPIEHELIKALWKFCFRLSNEDAEANREINTRCLHLLYKRNPIDFRRLVAQDSDYFSEISPNDAPLSELIRFLSACPALYSALNDAAKVLLMAHAKSDANLFAAALFLSDSFATHFSILKTFDYKLLIEISFANWNDLIIQARENNQLQEVFDFGIFMYINSGNFNLADSNFEKFVDKYIDEFDKERLLTLLNGIEENNQTSCRGKTWTDHPKIAKRVKAVGGIELANYPKFTCSLPPDK